MNRNLIFGVIAVAVVIFLGGRDKVIEFECFSDDGKDLVGQITEFSFLKKLHWEGDFQAVVSTEEYVMLNFLRGEKLGSGNQAIWSFKDLNNIDIQGQLRSARKDIIITDPFNFRGKCIFVGEG